MTAAEEFRRNLFIARHHAGLSQERLARKAGLATDTVHKIENGRRSPRLDTICLLAAALNLRPGELIDGFRP